MRKAILLLALFMVLLQGCGQKEQTIPAPNLTANQNIPNQVEKIEIYHFHGTNQCYSCKTVGAYAEATITSYYLPQIQSGKIIYESINYDLPENKELATKYGVSGSSLWIGVYDSQGFHPEQNTNVWYKINDQESFKNYLKGIIEKRLVGDFS